MEDLSMNGVHHGRGHHGDHGTMATDGKIGLMLRDARRMRLGEVGITTTGMRTGLRTGSRIGVVNVLGETEVDKGMEIAERMGKEMAAHEIIAEYEVEIRGRALCHRVLLLHRGMTGMGTHRVVRFLPWEKGEIHGVLVREMRRRHQRAR